VNEPSNPWLSGVSNLFTREFLEMGKRKLKKGGVWAHWIQLYGMDTADVRSLLGTFADVYPYVALFSTIRDADLVMIGSEQPLDFSAATLDAFVHSEPDVEADLDRIGIDSGSDLLARYQMDRQQMLALAHGVERNTDDNMRIEYSARSISTTTRRRATSVSCSRPCGLPWSASLASTDGSSSRSRTRKRRTGSTRSGR
jgi:spermidine synthase